MSDMGSTRISVRLDRELRAFIKRRAKATGKKEAELIREALEKEFTSPEPQKSWYALALELGLIGILKRAPSDLSTNRRHMEGFGRS
ncbi:MAG: hypothetical protein AUG75_09755 [Cyanobacteria bacterium 13_1_20CM_4_61_6]|nr:MAG: hypothetical protein AUG75_09755 [Cyanobacteria bacterium 13_1_20CM_4_61_6]